MRCVFGFLCVCALGVMGCGETTGTAGGGGSGGAGGDGGTGGTVAQCVDNVCRCTEAGIRAAIAAGGAEPYTFDCSSPTTVVTRRGEIDIDNDVTLDGRGMLTIHGNNAHRVLSVRAGITAELRGITVTGGVERPYGVGDEDGGGILNQGHLTLENCTVEGNTAPGSGGGIMNGVVGTNGDFVLTLRNSRVSGNTARISGGIGGWGVITLTDSTVSGNTGRGIGCACELTLTNSTVSYNTASSDNRIGGGIMQNARLGSLTLTNSTVSGNTSGYICGGIYSKGVITLTNSTVSYNTASSDGGGICVAGEATLTNSTVSHNTAAGGGGIDNLGVLRLVSSTISGNVATAQTGGSAILNQHGRVESSMATLIDGDCSPSAVRLTSRGYNIESPGNTCGFDQPTDRPETTPAELNLGPLVDNGGPTKTHKPGDGGLGEGSAAIDRIPESDCAVDTDQRGEPRPVVIVGPESCDVGSVEVQP